MTEAKAILTEYRQWHVPHCPLCGGEHWHGAGDPGDDPRAYLDHRAAHCGGGEYVLVEKTHAFDAES